MSKFHCGTQKYIRYAGYVTVISRCTHHSAVSCDRALRPLLHVLGTRTNRVVRGSEVALVERTDLVGFERSYDSVEHAAVVEQHQILLMPAKQ